MRRRGESTPAGLALIAVAAVIYVSVTAAGPGPRETVVVTDEYRLVLVNVSALPGPDDPVANESWLGKFVAPDGDAAVPTIAVARNVPRFDMMQVCSHEFRHLELYRRGVDVGEHHDMMERGRVLMPWEWDRRCLALVPRLTP